MEQCELHLQWSSRRATGKMLRQQARQGPTRRGVLSVRRRGFRGATHSFTGWSDGDQEETDRESGNSTSIKWLCQGHVHANLRSATTGLYARDRHTARGAEVVQFTGTLTVMEVPTDPPARNPRRALCLLAQQPTFLGGGGPPPAKPCHAPGRQAAARRDSPRHDEPPRRAHRAPLRLRWLQLSPGSRRASLSEKGCA